MLISGLLLQQIKIVVANWESLQEEPNGDV